MVVNNQFGIGFSLSRHWAVTDLQRKGESLGVPGMRCDGMNISDTHRVVSEALARVAEERVHCWSRPSHTASAATRWLTPRTIAARRSPSGAGATRSPPRRPLGTRRGAHKRAARADQAPRHRQLTRRSTPILALPPPGHALRGCVRASCSISRRTATTTWSPQVVR